MKYCRKCNQVKPLSAFIKIVLRRMVCKLAAKSRAQKNKIRFTLVIERIEFALLIGKCERTGIEFDLSSHSKYHVNPFSPSIDRINSFDGYTNENVKIVCSAYNIAKNQMTHDEFVDFCRKVVEFNK